MNDQKNSLYFIIIYVGILVNLSIIIFGAFMTAKTEYKTLGKSIVISGIISIMFICILIYVYRITLLGAA